MRILMVHPGPEFAVADVYNGWREAFGLLGVEAAHLNLHDRLAFYSNAHEPAKDGTMVPMLNLEGAVMLASKGIEAACFEMWPDALMVFYGVYVPPQVLDVVRQRGIKVVMVHTEEPYELGRELALAAHADLNLLNDPTHLAEFQAVAPSVYMPHAYRPTIHCPGPAVEAMRSDFVFIGTGFPSRVAFLEQVDWTGIDVALGGMWKVLEPGSPLAKFVAHDVEECIDNVEAVDAYRSSSVGANLYRFESDADGGPAGWAMSPREVEMAACGLFFLRDPRGEGDEVLPMLPRFADPVEFADLLRHYLARPGAREALAGKARDAVADRTFESNARNLLRLISK